MAWTLTEDLKQATSVLFNTCSVRREGAEKVFSDLGPRAGLSAASGPVIGVAAAWPARKGRPSSNAAPYVTSSRAADADRLPALIERRRAPANAAGRHLVFPRSRSSTPGPPARIEGDRVRLDHGRLQQVLQLLCGPYTRGEEVSRPFDDVLTEVADLADQGVREVTLLGQNVNAYRGPMADGESADFALLLEYVHEVPGIERIRYTTSHPKEFGQRLIDAYGRLPKLVGHVHLPVQAGSDRILARMKRGYTVLEYKSINRACCARRGPNSRSSSDFIVGFPAKRKTTSSAP